MHPETTVEWMKLRIKSMIWNIRNQKTTMQNKKKKNPENEGSISSLWDNLKRSNICIRGGGARRKREE